MITYSADSHELYGYLNFIPAGEHIEGTWIDVFDGDSGKYLGKIRQVRRTYSVVGLMNEFQVAVGETTFGGREELMDPKAVVDYGSLMNLALQRGRTAREALQVMTSLVAEYGYASSGESFSISDPNEVWILEMISKGPDRKGAVWVARLVPDGYVCAHANQPRIHQFPLQKANNFSDKKQTVFHCRRRRLLRPRERLLQGHRQRIQLRQRLRPARFRRPALLRRPRLGVLPPHHPGLQADGRLQGLRPGHQAGRAHAAVHQARPANCRSRDVMELMRDHFEGTEMDMTKDIGAGPFVLPYRWRPMTWKVDKDAKEEYIFERAVSTQQTAFFLRHPVALLAAQPHRRHLLVRPGRHLQHGLHAHVLRHPPGARQLRQGGRRLQPVQLGLGLLGVQLRGQLRLFPLLRHDPGHPAGAARTGREILRRAARAGSGRAGPVQTLARSWPATT